MRRALALLAAAPLFLAEPSQASCPAALVALSGESADRCRAEVGGVATAEGVGEVRYALYGFLETAAEADAPSAAALFEPAEPAPFWVAAIDRGKSRLERPFLVRSDDGDGLLVIRARYSGTAALVSDRVLFRTGDGWRDLGWTLDMETGEGVVRDVAAAAPEDLSVWKGVVIDDARRDGETPLRRHDDAACRPGGGALRLRLELNPETSALRLAGVE